MSGIRTEVMVELIKAADEEIEAGRWAPDSLRKRFPGLPESIAYEAWSKADSARMATEEARWWDAVEKTIDGEIIRKAIGGDLCPS